MDNKTTQPTYILSTRHLPQNKTSTQVKSEGMEKIFHANECESKARVAILPSDKIDFTTKTVTRDKKDDYRILKGSVKQENITIINICALNIGAPKYIRKILEDFKKDINSNTVIVGDFNPTVNNGQIFQTEKSTRIQWP